MKTKIKRVKIPKIISVSRRTDIPAFYSTWFFNRIKEGFVQVKKSVSSKTAKKVSLTPDDVRCFVFWTKNPGPMLDRLNELEKYQYYFHFTLTPYDQTIESFLPPKEKLITTFIQLSKKIGKGKVIWRYDPILLTDDIDIEYHKKKFTKLAKKFQGYTDKCIISFIDTGYLSKESKEQLKLKKITKELMLDIAKKIQPIGKKYKIKIETCVALSSTSILSFTIGTTPIQTTPTPTTTIKTIKTVATSALISTSYVVVINSKRIRHATFSQERSLH